MCKDMQLVNMTPANLRPETSNLKKGKTMSSSQDEQILRAAKEIIVKFIETGRVSPSAFPETFKIIYTSIKETVEGTEELPEPAENQPEAK